MVEFALGFMLFLALIVATFELGRAVWTYSTVSYAAKEATRYATIHGARNPVKDENGKNVTDTAIADIAKENVPGLDPSSINVKVNWKPDNSRGSNVEVTVSYTQDMVLAPIIGLTDALTVARKSTMLVIN